jgi:hypothetical protein
MSRDDSFKVSEGSKMNKKEHSKVKFDNEQVIEEIQTKLNKPLKKRRLSIIDSV